MIHCDDKMIQHVFVAARMQPTLTLLKKVKRLSTWLKRWPRTARPTPHLSTAHTPHALSDLNEALGVRSAAETVTNIIPTPYPPAGEQFHRGFNIARASLCCVFIFVRFLNFLFCIESFCFCFHTFLFGCILLFFMGLPIVSVLFLFFCFPFLYDASIVGGNNLSGSVPPDLFALPNLWILELGEFWVCCNRGNEILLTDIEY